MTDILSKFEELKRTVDEAQQKADRAAGALEQITKQLKNDFDCKSIEETKNKLKQLEKQKEETEQDFEKELKDFKIKWKGRLTF